MKLQETSKKEIKRIAVGVGICDVLLIAAMAVLSLLGIGSFSLVKILLGVLGGSAVAVGNFTFMCLTIQKAVNIDDQKLRKSSIQGSYNLRLMVQALWIVAAFLIPFVDVIAAAAPLLFPTVVIYYLQIKGRLVTPSDREAAPQQEEEEPQDRLESFEV